VSKWPMRPLGELDAPKRGSVNPADFPDESFELALQLDQTSKSSVPVTYCYRELLPT
jgi:hypothetical protein